MNITKAKREFEIRCYYWWVSELEKEINASFPNLRLFKSGFGWKLHSFMQELEPPDQLVLAQARGKRGSAYLEDSGEMMTEEETRLLQAFDGFALEPSRLEVEIQSRRQAGEGIKFASKRKLRKAAVSKFVEAFGAQCFDMKLGEEWDPLFHLKCCGWIISTQLVLGRRQGLFNYWHIIESETRIQHPQNPNITGPAMVLSSGVAWLAPFGNHWEDVMEADIEGVCNALIKHTGFFLEVAPKMLKGLEFEKITADS